MTLRIVALRYVLMITMLYHRPSQPHQGLVSGAEGTLLFEDHITAMIAARAIEKMHGDELIVDVEEIECEPEADDE